MSESWLGLCKPSLFEQLDFRSYPWQLLHLQSSVSPFFSPVTQECLTVVDRVLFVIMMYISVCEYFLFFSSFPEGWIRRHRQTPLRWGSSSSPSIYHWLTWDSVRSTNVYEEKSLGIFDAHEEETDGESEFQVSGPRMAVWSRYLAMHARKQLAFGRQIQYILRTRTPTSSW